MAKSKKVTKKAPKAPATPAAPATPTTKPEKGYSLKVPGQKSPEASARAKMAWGRMRTALWRHDRAVAVLAQAESLKKSDPAAYKALVEANQAVIKETRIEAEKQRKMTPAQFEALITKLSAAS
jgi:hypothetical protein